MTFIINFSSFSNSLFSRASEFDDFVKSAKVELKGYSNLKKLADYATKYVFDFRIAFKISNHQCLIIANRQEKFWVKNAF